MPTFASGATWGKADRPFAVQVLSQGQRHTTGIDDPLLQHFSSRLALQYLVQFRQCHQHARVALAQIALQPLAVMNERRKQQADQLAFIQAKKLLGIGGRTVPPCSTDNLVHQRVAKLPPTQVPRRVKHEVINPRLILQRAQAFSLQALQVRHQ